METQPFDIPTRDGRTRLTGQVDLPAGDGVMGWDADGDGRVTEADVERELSKDPLFAAVGMRREVLTPPAEGWALETIRTRFAEEYEAMRAAALAKPDDAPYPDPSPEFRMIAASNHWWKQFFEDATPMIDHLQSDDEWLTDTMFADAVGERHDVRIVEAYRPIKPIVLRRRPQIRKRPHS